MGQITINKAKIKDNLFLTAEYSEVISAGTKSISEDFTAPVHDDLKRAFKKLTIHLLLLTGQVFSDTDETGLPATFDKDRTLHLYDPEGEFFFNEAGWNIIDNTYCSGFTIGGNGDSEGVTLIGRRTLGNGKILNLVSPFQKWEGDSYNYAWLGELSEIISECRGEVHLYLFDGKHQPDTQLSLFYEEPGNTELSEQDQMDIEMPLTDEMAANAEKLKKKRGRKPKTTEE